MTGNVNDVVQLPAGIGRWSTNDSAVEGERNLPSYFNDYIEIPDDIRNLFHKAKSNFTQSRTSGTITANSVLKVKLIFNERFMNVFGSESAAITKIEEIFSKAKQVMLYPGLSTKIDLQQAGRKQKCFRYCLRKVSVCTKLIFFSSSL